MWDFLRWSLFSTARFTSKSLFRIVYTKSPTHALDLVLLLKILRLSIAVDNIAQQVQQIQLDVRHKLEQATYNYKATTNKTQRVKVFREGSYVMAHLCSNRFLVETCCKLKSCKYMPFLKHKENHDNAYMVELPDDMLISNTFNVANLFEYYP